MIVAITGAYTMEAEHLHGNVVFVAVGLHHQQRRRLFVLNEEVAA